MKTPFPLVKVPEPETIFGDYGPAKRCRYISDDEEKPEDDQEEE